MKFIITRHGETHQNVAKISMGHTIGGDLNDTGIIQARQLAQRLASEHISIIYTSDLQRAVDTTAMIAKFHPQTPILQEPLLRERNLGIYEGGPSEKWKEAMRNSSDPFQLFRPQGGESYADLHIRIEKFLQKIFRFGFSPTDSILIMSHTATVTIMLLRLFEKSITPEAYEQFKPEHTAITILDISEDKSIRTLLFNSIEHLQIDLPATIKNEPVPV